MCNNNLEAYYNKRVKIVDNLGKEWIGLVDMLSSPNDEDDGLQRLYLTEDKRKDMCIEFSEKEIISIDILK